MTGAALPPAADDDPGAVALVPACVLPRRVAMWAATDPDRPFLTEVTGRAATFGECWETTLRWCT